jgi:hypothetical protein
VLPLIFACVPDYDLHYGKRFLILVVLVKRLLVKYLSVIAGLSAFLNSLSSSLAAIPDADEEAIPELWGKVFRVSMVSDSLLKRRYTSIRSKFLNFGLKSSLVSFKKSSQTKKVSEFVFSLIVHPFGESQFSNRFTIIQCKTH